MDELKRRGIGQIIISGGEQSVSKNVVNQLGDFDVVRYSGHNRYETAREIARQVRLESGNTNEAVLVDGTNFPDGITVNSLASKFECPIHLTNPNTLTDITKKDISRLSFCIFCLILIYYHQLPKYFLPSSLKYPF